jgi:hypothetical protein
MSLIMYWLPLRLVLAYRLIPARRRRKIPYFGKRPSTSHRALFDIRMGFPAWQAIWEALKDNGGYHPDR